MAMIFSIQDIEYLSQVQKKKISLGTKQEIIAFMIIFQVLAIISMLYANDRMLLLRAEEIFYVYLSLVTFLESEKDKSEKKKPKRRKKRKESKKRHTI